MHFMYTLKEISEALDLELKGDGDTPIRDVRPFDLAGQGDLTLAGGRKYLARLSSCPASAAIVGRVEVEGDLPLLMTDNPKLAFARALQLFHGKRFEAEGISDQASIGEGCRIAEDVSIHPFVRIGDGSVIESEVTLHPGVVVGGRCTIGSGSVLYPNVTLYSGVSLGRRVILHAGTAIGADGFGYVLDGEEQVKVPQTGTVEIHDDVEIGANSCVDRATFGATILERGVKLDNHVHIAHNCRIGENTVIVGCVGVSGSVEIGRNCVLAGQSGVVDHVKIGDNVTVMVKTAVTKDVPSGMTVSGQPGRAHREELKRLVLIARLPEIFHEWKQLRTEIRKFIDS